VKTLTYELACRVHLRLLKSYLERQGKDDHTTRGRRELRRERKKKGEVKLKEGKLIGDLYRSTWYLIFTCLVFTFFSRFLFAFLFPSFHSFVSFASSIFLSLGAIVLLPCRHESLFLTRFPFHSGFSLVHPSPALSFLNASLSLSLSLSFSLSHPHVSDSHFPFICSASCRIFFSFYSATYT